MKENKIENFTLFRQFDTSAYYLGGLQRDKIYTKSTRQFTRNDSESVVEIWMLLLQFIHAGSVFKSQSES